MKTPEPVAISGALMAVITAGFGLAVLMGLPLSPEQVGAWITFLGAVIALVTMWQRSRVSPIAPDFPRPTRAARRAATASSRAISERGTL